MNGEEIPNVVVATPISLRSSDRGWEVLCGGRPPLILGTGANPALLKTVRLALDQRAQLHFALVPGSGGTISAITERLEPGLSPEVIKAAPVLPPTVTAQVIANKIPRTADQYVMDRVLWVTSIAPSRVIRLTFEKHAAPYYLAEIHPRKVAILQTAQNSIQSGGQVRVALSGQFVLDLLPIPTKDK